MTTTLTTREAIDHLFLLTLLSGKTYPSRILNQVMAAARKENGEPVLEVEVRVNGVELDFMEFTDEVRRQFDELVMSGVRRVLGDQVIEISHQLHDARQHAEDLCAALEAKARKAWGVPPRGSED